jgi:hypothetical protein
MNFRSRCSSTAAPTKKNDGLPIVNGRKVQRRNNSNIGDSGGEYFKGHSNNGNSNYNRLIRWMITAALIVTAMLIGLSDNSSSSSSSSSHNNRNNSPATTTEVVSSSSSQAAAAAAAAASATATTTSKTTPPPPPATTTTTTSASSWTATKFPPDQCTKEQLDATLKQLPDSLQCSR